MFCSNCGNTIADTAAFCSKCGTPVAAGKMQPVSAAPAPQPVAPAPAPAPQPVAPAPAPAPQPVAPAQNMYAQPAPAPNMGYPAPGPMPGMGYPTPVKIVPEGKSIRIRCEACKNVADVLVDTVCPKCGAPSIPGGYFKLYRMGSMYGVAMPFGIYIDNEPCGYIGNKQTCWIRLPYGTHRVHIAMAANRRCEDMMVTVAPEHPLEAGKVYMKPGFWTNKFVITSAQPSEVPN